MIYIICLQGISDQNNNIKTANNRANAKKKKQTNKKKNLTISNTGKNVDK